MRSFASQLEPLPKDDELIAIIQKLSADIHWTRLSAREGDETLEEILRELMTKPKQLCGVPFGHYPYPVLSTGNVDSANGNLTQPT